MIIKEKTTKTKSERKRKKLRVLKLPSCSGGSTFFLPIRLTTTTEPKTQYKHVQLKKLCLIIKKKKERGKLSCIIS
jgi:hypothetical protein